MDKLFFNEDGTRKGFFETELAAREYMAELERHGIAYSYYVESACRFFVKHLPCLFRTRGFSNHGVTALPLQLSTRASETVEEVKTLQRI